jgi:hypothetical protein
MKSEKSQPPQSRIMDWLEKYKTAIEIIVVMFIGVTISFCQLLALHNQNKILNVQFELARLQAMPGFVISYHQVLNEKTGKYDNDEILIENRGGYISGFSVDEIDLLKVDFVDNNTIPFNYTNYALPMFGYFDSQGVIETSGTGNLTRLIGYNNNSRFIDFQRGLMQIADMEKIIVDLDCKHFARLNYCDITGLSHEDYYEIKPVGGGYPLSTTEGSGIFKLFDSVNAKGGVLQLDSLVKSPQTFLAKIREKSGK